LSIVFTSNRQDAQGVKGAGKDMVYIASRQTSYQPFSGVRPLSALLNKDAHYGVLGQSVDGTKYFIYDGSNNNIYVLEGVLEGKQRLTDIGKYYGIKINTRYNIYSCAMSANEKTFYLCQDLPGGKGGADVWVCKRDESGKWGAFTNLESVNTKDDEICVSLVVEGENGVSGAVREFLYFSSNGNPGGKTSLGGYDIYRYDIMSGDISHLPSPINTVNNDVYYSSVPSFSEHCYYSSERSDELGVYDIYYIDYKTARENANAARSESERVAQENRLLEEKAARERALSDAAAARRRTDSVNAAAAAAAALASERERRLAAESKQRMDSINAAASAAALVASERERRLSAEALQREERLKSEQKERERDLKEKQAARERDLAAAARVREDSVARAAAAAVESKYASILAKKGYKEMSMIKIPQSGDKIYLQNVLFDKGKAVLAVSSYAVLDELFDFLLKFPNIVVEIGGHTSSEGSSAVNMKLSEQRAQSVKNYLTGKGIPASQLSSRGYAATQPIESETTEFGRTLNRRVEVVVK
jgi:outer membrane protein OmpA-like peptidoglycan-associated protein